MRTALVVIVLVLPTVLLASTRSAPVPGPWVTGHDHRDPSLHDLSWNLEETAWEPLAGDLAHLSGAHALEVRNGKLFVAAYGDMWSTGGGLYIFDIATDPQHPTLLGSLHGLGPMGGDRSMDATSDGAFVVLGTESTPAAYTKTGIVNPTPSGLLLIDARDPTLPRIADHLPSLGFHSVAIHRVGATDYIFGTDLGFAPFDVLRIDRGLPPRLVGTAYYGFLHDMSAFNDPVLGRPLVVAADGSSRLVRVYNVSTPATERSMGTWRFPAAQGPEPYYAHSALMWWTEGKRIIMVTSEHGGTEPTPTWFLDATNLSSMQLLAKWQPPVGGGPGLVFSLHNPRYLDGMLYFAHYHAGVVVFDVSTLAKIAAPELVAYAVPHHDTGYRAPLDPLQRAAGIDAIHYPRVYDVAVDPGSKTIYAADIFTGLYVYKRT